jgi:DtxR family Mn-dependent transcriptional regulator
MSIEKMIDKLLITEPEQELLEQLWIAAEENDRSGLPAAEAPDDAAGQLLAAGLAVRAREQLALTPAGHAEAARAIRRHRLAERLLVDVLMAEEAQVDEQACRMEHALFDGLDDSICTLLGHPEFCPHGKPIPRGECCRQARGSVSSLIAPLHELQPGQHGRIAYMQMNNPARLQKLMAMGVLPGVPVKLVRRSPSFVFEAGHSQFAVDDEIAANVYVRLTA